MTNGKRCGLYDGHPGKHSSERTEYLKKWHQNNSERMKKRRIDRFNTVSGRIKYMYQSANQRCKKTGDIFTITQTDIKNVWRDFCAYCMCEWGLSGTRKVPTLDKIVPIKGYAPSNIAVVCFDCNTHKSNMSPYELRMLAESIEAEIERQKYVL